MKNLVVVCLTIVTVWSAGITGPAYAESHRATHLGNPATRFAPPLATPEDLRALFRNEKLRPDFAAVLQQWGWTGRLDDLFAAAATAEIADIKIPIGTVMPFMSSRKNGRPICLRNVLWAGKEPAPAYAFTFTSLGRRYRCITPKACSNFFLEELGAEPRFGLALECTTPDGVIAGRPVPVCLTVRNTGDVPLRKAQVVLDIPEGATLVRTTEGGNAAEGRAIWELANLQPGTPRQVCANLAMRQPGVLSFRATADSPGAASATTACATRIAGIPAILLELVDLEDPIEVGHEITYEIKVTNQGSAPATNVRVTCTLPSSMEFVSGTGPTPVQGAGDTVTMSPLAGLDAKAVATWRVVTKALREDDARFKVSVRSDQFERAIVEDESTQLY
ncbi:MAG: DUF11 domain-containing protein [Verrucomicrobia bacterium]|nr:DUF11 domain-containing protein [Verrucomicrobiota bacterium]